MRKVAGTKYAKDLIPSVLPNVRNDTSAKPIVIENPDSGDLYNENPAGQPGTLTKEQVARFINSNGTQIEDVMLSNHKTQEQVTHEYIK